MKIKQYKITAALLISMSFLFGCASLNPARQAELLKNYRYDVQSVTGMQIAGTSLEGLNASSGNTSLNSLPGLVLGIMRKDLPLEANVNLQVSNPTEQTGSINAFQYLIEIQGKPFFEGTVNQNIRLANGESTVVPLTFKANLFGLTDDRNGIERVLSDVFTRQGNGFVVLKIKPSINIGGRNLFYPGYITVDDDLFKSIRGLLQ